MKIHIQRDKFAPLFSLISNFTSTRDLRPALQNVKIIADESSVVLMATDGDVGARGEIVVDESFVIDRPGEAILPAKLLGRIFSETTDSDILLELEGRRLTVKGARFRYQLDTIDDVDSFPAVNPFQETDYFELPVESLNRMIGRTLFAIETNNAHYELNGVMFLFEQERATAIATDGKRLACQQYASKYISDGQGGEFNEKKAIFPTRTLNLVKRSASFASEAKIAVKDDRATIQLGNVVIATNLMTGRFPDWNMILLEKSNIKSVDFIASEFASAVRQAEIVATENKPGVTLNFESGKVSITAAGEETGESSVELPISYDAEPRKLRFDSKFLNDFFREVPPEETVLFYFSQKLEDFRSLFETNDGYRYVVMQLQF